MKSKLKSLPQTELRKRLKKCSKCYWWVRDKNFCRLNWLINREWSYRRLCGFDPNLSDRFTPKRKEGK